jgi:RNA ligase
MNIKDLDLLVEQKYINVQKHPEADLFIYNYTQSAQYEAMWNETTLMCRGLILNGEGEIMARPFAKFFNWEELKKEQIPTESFEVYEKMDGSLGILYWLNGEAKIATRGSFTSEQAIVATEILHSKYADSIPLFDKSKTYLFEIIYPENRIVLDYGDERKLVLLAIIDTKTGDDVPLNVETLHATSLPTVKKYDGFNDFNELKNINAANKEGFVIKFKNGFRFKIKFEEYIRLHRILTNVSNKDIWECLAENKSFDAFLKDVPDEFYDWVKTTKIALEADYQAIETECKANLKDFGDRRTTAEYLLSKPHSGVLFKMLDGQKYDYIIWKIVKPKFQKAFKNQE